MLVRVWIHHLCLNIIVELLLLDLHKNMFAEVLADEFLQLLLALAASRADSRQMKKIK